jgi:Zn ribbon nucleic-acid-binding protein
MKVRADVAELLHAGHSNRAIARQLHTDAKDVANAREVLGLPKAKPGKKPSGTAEDLFWRRVKPTDDGHMEWTGFHVASTPALRHGGRNQTAYRIAFRIATGRDPEGQALPSCGRQHCVKPGHHEDRADRTRRQQQERDARAKARARAVSTIEDEFWRRAVTTDDDHMEWSGVRDRDSYPLLRHASRQHSAFRIAFRIAKGREPEGQVWPSCGRDRCVKPGHHTDRADRQAEKRVDALYAGIFGPDA